MILQRFNLEEILFGGGGLCAEPGDINFRFHFTDPTELTKPEGVLAYSRSAEKSIKMLEEIQKVLSEYIVRLSERYIYLDTTPNELIVKLFAKPDGKRMYYYLTEIRRYKDGTENEINGEQFLESEREQAIAKFREYQRTHPGIKSEVSI